MSRNEPDPSGEDDIANIRQFLIVYDYGQGGIWAIVTARSRNEVQLNLPHFEIQDEGPPWRDQFRVSLIPAPLRFSINTILAIWKQGC